MSDFLKKKGLYDLSANNNTNNNVRYSTAGYGEQEESDDIEQETGYEPVFALPYLNIDRECYNWPKKLKTLYFLAKTEQLKDAAFLTALTLLPFTIAPKLRVRYNNVDFFCAPMLLFAAPPAAGKSIIGELFHLLDIEDKRRRDIYAKEFAAYDKRKNEIAQMGKSKVSVEMPKEPHPYMAKISADNTASGLLENIADCKGHCAMVDTEMFDLAQSTDRKGFGDPTVHLCKAWSHEDLSMNRRTNKENFYVEFPVVPINMTGTPFQIQGLIKSPENGFFSRILYYHIPVEEQWQSAKMEDEDQDDDAENQSHKKMILSFAREWEALLHKKFDSVSDIRLLLSEEQKASYNNTLIQLNERAAASNKDMLSYVRRLGPNILRLCTSLALVRALEPESAGLNLLKPRKGTNPDNIKDNICPLLDLHITDEDFNSLLDMAMVFYLHAAHTLSLLKESTTVSLQTSSKDVFFDDMEDIFTTGFAKAYVKKKGVSERTATKWIADFVKHGKLKRLEAGVYQKTHTMKNC